MGNGPQRRRNDRPPMAVAMRWVSQITTVGLEMALPAALGYWLDQKWGTDPWLLIAGSVLGFVVAMYELYRMAQQMAEADKRSRRDRPNRDHEK